MHKSCTREQRDLVDVSLASRAQGQLQERSTEQQQRTKQSNGIAIAFTDSQLTCNQNYPKNRSNYFDDLHSGVLLLYGEFTALDEAPLARADPTSSEIIPPVVVA